MAAGEDSFPYVNQILTLFAALRRISDTAIAATIQTHGARTSIKRTITHEKYVARTAYIPKNNLPCVTL